MGANSGIQWTHHTFNPWRGCSKVSEGCDHCYAEKMSRRNPAVLGIWGDEGKRSFAAESYWSLPRKWNREAEQKGERHRVFCASLADWLEDRPELDRPLARLLETINDTPYLDWLLLTKRPHLWGARMDAAAICGARTDQESEGAEIAGDWRHGIILPNIWIGVSVEDQQRAEERIPLLLKIPARMRFLSIEPLLGPVNLSRWLDWQEFRKCARCKAVGPDGLLCSSCGALDLAGAAVDWVIVGGESGSDRLCDVENIRAVVEQCRANGTAVFVKQLGSNPIRTYETEFFHDERRIPLNLVDKKGGDIQEWPEDLRFRELPEVA